MKHLQVSLLFTLSIVALSGAPRIQAASPSTAPDAPVATAQSAARPWTVADSDVYVDRETRFAFVRTPKGWRFTRRIEADKLAQVPVEFFIPINDRVGAIGALDLPTRTR